LRTDPLERADITSNTYYDWFLSQSPWLLAAQAVVGKYMQTFAEFPPRQKAASFTVEQAHEKMESAAGGSK
jgi:arylsulfatase